LAKRNSLVLHADVAICAIHTVHNHDALSLVRWVLLRFLLFEDKHTRFIIVEDSNSCACIFSEKALASALVVYFNIEILIRLPSFVVNDLDFDFSLILAVFENHLVIISYVVVTSVGITVKGTYPDSSSFLRLVQDFDS